MTNPTHLSPEPADRDSTWQAASPRQVTVKRSGSYTERGYRNGATVRAWRCVVSRHLADGSREEKTFHTEHQKKDAARRCAEAGARKLNRVGS